MDGVGITKQIMQISQNLLVCTDQEEADVVVLVLFDLVQRQVLGTSVFTDKTGYLTIRITGDIRNGGNHVRFLVKALQRHDRKKLIDCPGVRN